jgi:hypothetical protein
MRVCGYCLMPNHWHFVLWPERDGDYGRVYAIASIARTKRGRYSALGRFLGFTGGPTS